MSIEETEVIEVVETPAEETQKPKKVWAGKRLVALIAGVAVVSLLLGVALMQFVVSPAEVLANTEAPEPGPVTAVIEDRVIENLVTTRGEVTYADPVQVTIDTAFSEGRPIVTGQVPAVGAVLEAGNVALEVTGRPVIVLPGELPSYRSLAIGMRGPDVIQLKQALGTLGIYAGNPESDLFEWDTSVAVGQLFERVGYTPPTGGPEALEVLRNAQNNVRSAEGNLNRAYSAYNTAYAASQTPPAEGEPPLEVDLSLLLADIDDAEAALADANEMLEEAQIAVQPTLPSGEVLFMPSLPRRVDEVFVKRGDTVEGPVMTVSGATLTIQGTVSKQDADLLKDGMEAFYQGPDGEELVATIKTIEAPSGSSGEGEAASSDRYRLTLNPGKLTEEQISALRGTNVRITIPIASTDGSVAAVPLAALSAGPDGGNRVELLVPTKDDPFATELVPVTIGLSAGGFVEISSDDPRIEPGAKIVVGR
ncbi:hypothetical protein [Actinomyces minihominis]|uniref:hypothetical protein n=1 Tax=Actinomyces minihominis TaxID=2002838 RepID=UPI001A929E1F|nr:hypothetical protein [Actinomyces minihominis]